MSGTGWLVPEPEARIQQIEEVLEDQPADLATKSSVESIRSSTGGGLATLPYLTINDIIALRDEEITQLEQIEARMLDLPDEAWSHVLDLVRARVVQVSPSELRNDLEGRHNGSSE